MTKNTLKIWLTGTVVLLTLSCNVYAHDKKADNHGFDQLCDIYTQVFTVKKYSHLTLRQKISMVDTMVHKTLNSAASVDAIEAYTASFQVEPAQRYDIMKKSAELSLNKPWKCNEMQKIYHKIATSMPTQQEDNGRKHSLP